MALKPLDQQQKKSSNTLAFAIIFVYVALTILAWALHVWPAWLGIALVTLASGFFAVVNFKNTFSSNDDWKSWGGAIAIILNVIIYAGPIGRHAIGG